MKQKLKHIITLFLFLAAGANAHAEWELLIYGPAYGSGTADLLFDCWLEDKPVIDITPDGIVVKSSAMETTLLYSEIGHIEFKNNDTGVLTDIEEVDDELTAKFRFYFTDNETAIAEGVVENATTGLYSIDGKVVAGATSQTGNRVTASLRGLPKGMYIFRVENQSFKLIKR